MAHPRCVSWGEIGLDYHYSLSPHDVQQAVFRRQLTRAVELKKPITIHTREAEEDTERIMKELIPPETPIHVHCFTDSPEFAQRLLSHFPNLYIGITGVVTYTTNFNTSEILRRLSDSASPSGEDGRPLRILLETDSPYMTPSNIYDSLPELKKPGNSSGNLRLPFCHSGMIPWTAEFVSDVLNSHAGQNDPRWDVEAIMRVSAENARRMYGI